MSLPLPLLLLPTPPPPDKGEGNSLLECILVIGELLLVLEGDPFLLLLLFVSWAEALAALIEDGSLRAGEDGVEGIGEAVLANAGGGCSRNAVIRS